MPKFVELDERTPLASQMQESVGPVILINTLRGPHAVSGGRSNIPPRDVDSEPRRSIY